MQGKVGMSGKLKIKKIRPKKEGMIKMLLKKIRPFMQKFGLMMPIKGVTEMYGSLAVKKIGADGDVFDYGLVSRKNVTTVFVNHLVDAMQSTGAMVNVFKWHGSGVTTGAAAITDTQLGAGSTAFDRDEGTQTTGASANIYESVATHTYAAAAVITEHGIFSSSSSGAGDVLLDRHVFAAINCSSGDSIQFTYDLTATAEA